MRRKNSKVAIVPLKGINTSTPDNTVEDGACEVLHNMRIKDGAWRNVEPLKFIDSLGTYNIGTYEETRRVVEVLYKHPSASEGSYVVAVEVSNSGEVVGKEIVNVDSGEITCTFFTDAYTELSVMHLGRLLILNIDGAMYYWRNKENTGNYSPTSLPQPASITLSEKVITSRPTPYVHTKGQKGNVLNSTSPSYITAFAYYGYKDRETGDGEVFFPIFSKDVGFVQPTVRDDWWWGEICFFAAFKTVDGYYLSPSALTIVASELDNAGEYSDLEMPYEEGNYNFGVEDLISETGFANGKITLDQGDLRGQSDTNYRWAERNRSDIDYQHDYASNGLSKSIGVEGFINELSPYASRLLANALMIAPTCNISFEATELVDSIVIFSTRIHPRWSAEGLSQIWETLNETDSMIDGLVNDYAKAFADNDLPNQPFYKILEVPHDMWGESSEGHYSLEIALTGTLLENAEQKEVWEPINPHELVYSSGKEINSMMHIFGEITQRFFDGYGSNGLKRIDTECEAGWSIATAFEMEGKNYCVTNPCGFDLSDDSKRKNIISYPDYRAREMYNGSSFMMRNNYALTSALANNFAYYTADIFESDANPSALKYYTEKTMDDGRHLRTYWCKFPHRWKDTRFYIDGRPTPIGIAYEDASAYGGNSISQYSELRVSALSNPLVFPLSRTYQIGSDDNQIIAINSAAIELSDDKIGEYPTWVFTTEGVFIGHWGEGDDVIYRAFLPRTYDRICNPNTLAVNGSILFISLQGLMSINERGSQLLSSPLNSLWGKTPKWLVEAKLLGWKYDTNEVMVAGDDSDIYVFNLGAGLWSSRSKPITYISKLLANNVLVGGDSQTIYSIQQEGDFSSGGGYVRILTRSIKMGEYEMKRIETLIARLSASAKLPFEITIYGSIDGVKYGILRQATVAEQSSIRLTHVPMSVRYIKIGIEFPSSTEMAFTSFDIEYYNRFVNRLR